MEINKVINEMTLDEKIALLCGTDFMYTNSVPKYDIPSVCMSDGPHGLRKQVEGNADNGIAQSEPATAFPTAATIASSWNPDNTYRMGQAIAEECICYDVDVLLGPGVNIKRNPLCGRNFEYFSEDPFLAGRMGAAEVEGVQSKGVGVSLKHFAMNNSENYRFMGNSVADARAIREIYLKPFEYIIKKANPATVMCAYNQINGTYCSENTWLLTDVLRDEWGFDGIVMTDWGATHDRVKGLLAGLELEMPGDVKICRKWITDAVQTGRLSRKTLDMEVYRMLKFVELCTKNKAETKLHEKEFTNVMKLEHHNLAAKIAMDSAVLLENDGILPLVAKGSYFVVGELFEKMRYQGAGSSMISATILNTPKQEFDRRKIDYQYVNGYKENTTTSDPVLIAEAVKKAKNYEIIILFAGLTDYTESEGTDRESMKLPQNQIDLIQAMIQNHKKIVLVLYGGSSIELLFAKKVNAILDMYLPGQNGGYATASLLFGEVSPSGRLAETWVASYEDVPFGDEFGKNCIEKYKESIYVGYRYYQTFDKEVRYPFGYGLSYTEFEYTDLSVCNENNQVQIACRISNVGKTDGAEVVQIYVKKPDSVIWKAERELKAFQKIYLKHGEQKKMHLTIDIEELKSYSVAEQAFLLEDGQYVIQVNQDANHVIMQEEVYISGVQGKLAKEENDVRNIYANRNLEMEMVTDQIFEQLLGKELPKQAPLLPITMESRFTDLKQTFMGRILFQAVLSVAANSEKKALKMTAGSERDNKLKGAIFLRRILESNSIISMCMCSGKAFPFHIATGFVELANGHLFKGIKCMILAPKVNKLPKEQ